MTEDIDTISPLTFKFWPEYLHFAFIFSIFAPETNCRLLHLRIVFNARCKIFAHTLQHFAPPAAKHFPVSRKLSGTNSFPLFNKPLSPFPGGVEPF
ncbi:MAG: hypothetical protein IJ580_06475 [Prevotella sp.]|nr:hypothetical protein [Prevotella sp.]